MIFISLLYLLLCICSHFSKFGVFVLGILNADIIKSVYDIGNIFLCRYLISIDYKSYFIITYITTFMLIRWAVICVFLSSASTPIWTEDRAEVILIAVDPLKLLIQINIPWRILFVIAFWLEVIEIFVRVLFHDVRIVNATVNIYMTTHNNRSVLSLAHN